MSCGELLSGCMPPPRSMYDAKKTDAYQPDSEGQPLHRMKARANAVSVSGDGNGHTIMLAPGVEFIAKHKVYATRPLSTSPPKQLPSESSQAAASLTGQRIGRVQQTATRCGSARGFGRR